MGGLVMNHDSHRETLEQIQRDADTRINALTTQIAELTPELARTKEIREHVTLVLAKLYGIQERSEPSVQEVSLVGLGPADAALAVIKGTGKPMRLIDILRRMEKGGRPIAGKRPYNALTSIILRDSRFVRVSRGTYGIASVPPEEARTTPKLGERPVQMALAGMGIVEAAEQILRTISHPLTVQEIAEALAQGGKELSAKNPADSIRVMLARHRDKFTHQGGRWGLKAS